MDRLHFTITIWVVLLCLGAAVSLEDTPDFRTIEQIPAIFKQEKSDSLNVRFVGNWPFGKSYAVAIDSARNLAFCGSGGGVYILDVSILQARKRFLRSSTPVDLSGDSFMNLLSKYYTSQVGLLGLKSGMFRLLQTL